MAKVVSLFALLGFVLFGTGCSTVKFSHSAPPPKIHPTGPALTVLPIKDSRSDKKTDSAFEKGLLENLRTAIAAEAAASGKFKEVGLGMVSTNGSLTLRADLTRFEWNIPDYNKLLTKAFFVGLTTGIVGGSIYSMTSIEVCGHSDMAVEIADPSGKILLRDTYPKTVTEKVKKGVCDTNGTKAKMATGAFSLSLTSMREKLASAEELKGSVVSPEDTGN